MRVLRRNRFALVFLALLIFCSAMVMRQFRANQSRHVELREEFILQHSNGYTREAEELYIRLLREIEDLPDKTLQDDYQRTLMLVDPRTQHEDNPVWRYHWTVSRELDRRSESTLLRARKPAGEEK